MERVTADLLSIDAYFDKPEHPPTGEHMLIIREAATNRLLEDKLLTEIKSAAAEDLQFRELSDPIH